MSQDQADAVDAPPSKEKPITDKKLDYFLKNGFRHIFHVLDFNKQGVVNKSSLQVICANICRVLDILYMREHLESFKGEISRLDEEGFLEYVCHLVGKAIDEGKQIHFGRLEEVSWVVINKVRAPEGRILSGPDTFLLLRVFNKFDIHGDLVIHRHEAARIIESFMKAIGTPWTSGPMDNFSSAEFWTFWKLLECLETKYICSSPRSLYEEGLLAIDDRYLKEITKAGILIKKGHKVKSLKERWFVLQPGKLSYYTTKTMKELKGCIVLSSESKVGNVPDSKNGKCRFTVTCGETNVSYEMEADTQRDKNEWMNLIQATIDCPQGNSLLYWDLQKRFDERAKRQQAFEEEEQKQKAQESLIKQQMKDLENMKIAQEKAEAQAEKEAALLEEERKRREELEILKEEYEKLLEGERKAREEEENVRKMQEKILEEERQKREDLEKIKSMQEDLLEQERKRREGLEEESKEQAKALEEERQRLKELDEARKKAEEAIAEAHAKLEAAEEERRRKAEAVEIAKNRTRRMKLPQGLARPLSLALQEGLVTHRGPGAFVDTDFEKQEPRDESIIPEPVNKTVDDGSERAVIVESNLVKPSEKGSFLKDE